MAVPRRIVVEAAAKARTGAVEETVAEEATDEAAQPSPQTGTERRGTSSADKRRHDP